MNINKYKKKEQLISTAPNVPKNKQTDLYRKYMQSEAWQAKKQQRLEIDGYKCVMCGKPLSKCKSMPLQCHHITYARLGHENVHTDLVTLCGSCHRKIHNYYQRKKSATAIAPSVSLPTPRKDR